MQRSSRALWRSVGRDVLVTMPEDDEIHELAGGASAAWRAIDAPLAMSELIDRLALEHGADPAGIRGEVETCMEELIRLRVVEVVARGVDD